MDVRRERCSTVGLGVLVLALAGCGKQTPPPLPPVETGGDTATAQQDVRPGEVVNSYEGREDEDDVDADDEAEGEGEDDDTSEAAAADDGKLDAVELLALANAALDQALEPGVPRVVTPLLPTEWPSTSGKVMVLAYPLAALESGVTRYTLFAASHRVTIDVNDGTVTTEPIGKKGKKLGSFEKTRERSDDPIHGAEAALVDVVAGRKPPEKARMLLMPYTQWVESHGAVGKDVDARMKGFVESLQRK
jgi:hypothetical protein